MTDTSTTPATRVVDGRNVPTAGTWTVDKSHSTVDFVVRHLAVAKTRGRFADWDATFVVAERPEDSSVTATFRTASISTGDDSRDGHLQSPDFLDVEAFPTLSFVSTAVSPVGDDTWSVAGDLTIRDTSRPVTLTVEFAGVTTDPWGAQKAFFSASTEFDREDWGLTYNAPLANGGVLIGKKIKIEIEIEAARAD